MSAHNNHMRALTADEIALCRSVFPDALPYEDVRLCDGPAVNDLAERAFHNRNTAITLRRTIYFRTHYCRDFAQAGNEARRLFLHEMTHVWQWWKLGMPRFLFRYGRELAGCRFDAAAMYRYEGDPRPFGECRLEAQAEMVGDYQRPDRQARLVHRLRGTGVYGL